MDEPRIPLIEALKAAAIAIAVAAVLIVCATRVPRRSHQGAALTAWRQQLADVKPRVVFLGNSMVRAGIDADQFEDLTGVRALKIDQGGSETAYWYLILKNVIVPAAHPPEVVVIFYRDHFLTVPTMRTDGRYLDAIDDVSVGREEVLARFVSIPEAKAVPWTVEVAQLRERVRARSETLIKAWVGRSLGRDRGAPDRAIARVFEEANLAPGVMTKRQLAAEQASDASDFDFPARIDHSFLPSILELAEANHLRLIFVRIKRRRDVAPDVQPPGLPEYIAQLGAYLDRHGIPMIDFTDDPRLVDADFANGDHLNATTGRPRFTAMLAEALGPYL